MVILAYFYSGTLLQFIVVGLIVGLLIDLCLRGKSYGFIGNTLLGIAGAAVGTFLWEKLLIKHVQLELGSITLRFEMILVALLGAGLLLLIIKLIESSKKKQ